MTKAMSDGALKAEILERRRTGTPMKQIVGIGRLTSDWQFERLKRDDPAFRQAFLDVNATLGIVGRSFVFDTALKAKVVGLIQGGWDTSQKPPCPGVPSWEVIRRYRKEDPEFDHAVRDAFAAKKAPAKTPLASKLCLSDGEKREILRRLRQGVQMSDLGSDLPPAKRILVHRRADPDFDREVARFLEDAAARRCPQRIERTDELRKAVIDALAAGRPMSALGPGLPSYSALLQWRQDDPAFAEAISRCLDERAKARKVVKISSSDGALPFATETMRRTLAQVEEGKRQFLANLTDGITLRELYRTVRSQCAVEAWRKNDPVFDAAFQAKLADRRTPIGSLIRHGWTEDHNRSVVEALKAGATFSDLGCNLPSLGRIRRRREFDPTFDRAVVAALAKRRALKASSRKPKLVRPASMPLTFQLTQTNDLYAAANRAVSRSFPPHVRDDIISEIVLSVLAGETQQDEIATAAKAFANAYLRDQNGYALASIDAVVGANGSGNFYDLIATS